MVPDLESVRHTARNAWESVHQDPVRSLAMAEQALSNAGEHAEPIAWALIARGFYRLYFARPADAREDLARAEATLRAHRDKEASIVAATGLARAIWREGHVEEALAKLLPMRAQALQLLPVYPRGIFLNTIAGCYSAQGDSELAFGHLYEALRGCRPELAHGFDAALHCNIAHELLQLGDYHEALRHIDVGLERCKRMKNPFMQSILMLNRTICLTDLGRSADAINDILLIRELLASPEAPGPVAERLNMLAVAALRGGDSVLGADIIASSRLSFQSGAADEIVLAAVARALLEQSNGHAEEALSTLRSAQHVTEDARAPSLSLRILCMYLTVLSELLEERGEYAAALSAARRCQNAQLYRSERASIARYQAAAYVPEGVLRQLNAEGSKTASARERQSLLTVREAEVAALLTRGFTYKQIAKHLGQGGKSISEHTVRVHVDRIASKLGVEENAKAGVMAEIARRGWVF